MSIKNKMAAPCQVKFLTKLQGFLVAQGHSRRIIYRTAFFSRKDTTEEKTGKDLLDEVDSSILQKKTTSDALRYLKRKTSVDTVKGYSPPSDVEARISMITQDLCGNVPDWKVVSLEDRRLKYKILTKCMAEFDHNIPNSQLLGMNTVQDAVDFFKAQTKETSAYDDLGKLELPKNLHIQMEPKRWDHETDNLFGGVSAFPGSDTVVTSIKYKQKYKTLKAKKWTTG